MFRVEDDAFAARSEKAHAVRNHFQVFFRGRVQHFVDVTQTCLAEKAHGVRACRKQFFKPFVLFRRTVSAACGAERDELRVAAFGEKFRVFRVGRGVAALDEVDAERGEQREYLLFVGEGIAYPRRLRSVAQSGVIELNPHFIPLAAACWWR